MDVVVVVVVVVVILIVVVVVVIVIVLVIVFLIVKALKTQNAALKKTLANLESYEKKLEARDT